MADAEKGSEEQPKVEETTTEESTPRNYSKDEFDEVVDQRQGLKKKLEQYEKADKKRKDEAEAAAKEKAISEGNAKDVLATQEKELKTLREKAEHYEDQEKKQRKVLIDRLAEDVDKMAAKTIPDINALQQYVDAKSTDKTEPYGGKAQTGKPDFDIRNFKGTQQQLIEEMRARGYRVNEDAE